MTKTYRFQQVARLPLPGDNVAIATRRLEAGDQIRHDSGLFTLSHTLLEGHRFAIRPIPPGAALLSWQLPFGYATRAIQAGEYVCNPGILQALSKFSLDFALPDSPNFRDEIRPYQLDGATLRPAEQVSPYPQPGQFLGVPRSHDRGTGTRNVILLLGVSSLASGFVRRLEARLQGRLAGRPNLDGIVAVAHSEGAAAPAYNSDLLLRTLAGFALHPNVGAVLAVDEGSEAVDGAMLRGFIDRQNLPLDSLPHHFMSLSGNFERDLARAEALVTGWLAEVGRVKRTAVPLSQLKLALQCGGSDAFSGISGNPLLSWATRELLRHGGSANFGETVELVGAESYVLQRVRDVATAQKFLDTMARYKEWAGWHGATAEGNTSGGNKYRGLYNITVKSIGAARKRHPNVRLDYVIDYAEPMQRPGFYFMDSPGNDLESIAGQVAAGCNLIVFVTGNGSITNFPFVPTIKIITTSERYRLLQDDMDVNAGAYLDGVSMEKLGRKLFRQLIDVASGQRTLGEKAGHAQVQIWRNWGINGPEAAKADGPRPSGKPLPVRPPGETFEALRLLHAPAFITPAGPGSEQVGLILPTSLCSAQIAQLAAERLNRAGLGREQGISRFVALPHTEGCGCSDAASDYAIQTLLAYLRHPAVAHCLMLEHGCEKTHNGYVRGKLPALGLDAAQFGWASVQLDGGIERTLDKVAGWFEKRLAAAAPIPVEEISLLSRRFGLLSAGPTSPAVASILARLTTSMAAGGGAIIVPAGDSLLEAGPYRASILADQAIEPSLAFAEAAGRPGFQVMATPTNHWVENLTGLAAAGVDLILAPVTSGPVQGHPLVPVLQITSDPALFAAHPDDIDLLLPSQPGPGLRKLAALLVDTLAQRYTPASIRQRNVDFQLSRGLWGISL